MNRICEDEVKRAIRYANKIGLTGNKIKVISIIPQKDAGISDGYDIIFHLEAVK